MAARRTDPIPKGVAAGELGRQEMKGERGHECEGKEERWVKQQRECLSGFMATLKEWHFLRNGQCEYLCQREG